MATTKEALRELVERLSEEDARELLDYARWLAGEEDPEPLSSREKTELAEAEAERAAGGGEEWTKVKRHLEL